jgi:hypothetical protein
MRWSGVVRSAVLAVHANPGEQIPLQIAAAASWHGVCVMHEALQPSVTVRPTDARSERNASVAVTTQSELVSQADKVQSTEPTEALRM